MLDNVAEWREQGMATAVVRHELIDGGGTAPPLADIAATHDVPGWQTGEDLFNNDQLGKLVEHSLDSVARHGDCWLLVLHQTRFQITRNERGDVRMVHGGFVARARGFHLGWTKESDDGELPHLYRRGIICLLCMPHLKSFCPCDKSTMHHSYVSSLFLVFQNRI